jgi:hypothetical protein
VACCEKPFFEVGVDGLSDDWGNNFESRSIVIGGHYHQRWGLSNRGDGVCYINFLEQGLAFFYTHLVHASKFVMSLAYYRVVSNTLVYRMSVDTEDLICANLLTMEDIS